MFLRTWLKRLMCRRMLTLVLFLYFLMILLFALNLDFTEPDLEEDDSFGLIFPESTFNSKRDQLSNLVNRSSRGHKPIILEDGANSYNSIVGATNTEDGFDRNGVIKFAEPIPLLEPLTDNKAHGVRSGDFISLGKGAYVYSAFMDDRKEQSSIRILTLMSQYASQEFIYCHFNETPSSIPVRSEIYQLCENHNKMYGGFFYSCRVPQNSDIGMLKAIVISFTREGPMVILPLRSVQPQKQKLAYLNLYSERPYVEDETEKKSLNEKLNVPSIQPSLNSSSGKNEQKPSSPTLSFAICVCPLFGNISVHRLVEFVELSRLLGADHFIFYNHSVSKGISDVLRYYMSKGIVSVLPWALPMDASLVWYYSQLLANNDCLYRTMPHFDLVSFNDIDEFIVPHSNVSTWKDAFPSLLTDDRCGFSFQSAFYDPGMREPSESTLLTPSLTARTETYSKLRTKVMACPWRVFEVGIHHISKQNRENWHSWGVSPSVAYLHHYRRCVPNFGMRCDMWQKDLTIASRYLKNLTSNYERELTNILSLQEAR